jgi:hypothetical protein
MPEETENTKNETAQERFRRLAGTRVPAAELALERVAKLTSTEVPEADRQMVAEILTEAMQKALRALQTGTTSRALQFPAIETEPEAAPAEQATEEAAKPEAELAEPVVEAAAPGLDLSSPSPFGG